MRTPRNPMELQGVITALMKQTTDEAAGVLGFHTSQLKITCADETPWTLDGEYGGAPKVVEIAAWPPCGEYCLRRLTPLVPALIPALPFGSAVFSVSKFVLICEKIVNLALISVSGHFLLSYVQIAANWNIFYLF